MFERVKHWYQLRKLAQERRATQAYYDKEYDKAETEDAEQSVIAVMFQEVGVLDEKIGLLLSQRVQQEAAHLHIPTPPFSETSGKWVEGVYTSAWRLSPEQIHKLRATVRKERKERWELMQSRLTLLIGFGGMLIGLVSVLKK
ncbi:hypothetical protein [Bradyrhizobium sp. SZCCHNR1045]|uniref:hypothetical protein n=1 Tax=Bradyrhizobium sp. SZCCHNR1045 TaxID=3057353 RepID=UPI002915DE11|nr:hypothetical protein [Bradyrhizobium sp. SZCCHNR1045]